MSQRKKSSFPAATESEEQQALFEWARWYSMKYPELTLLYHIPNEGKRSYYTGKKMKKEGLRAGVPDICLPVARGEYHGLYIELKRTAGGRMSDKQKSWLEDLKGQGYCAAVCRGWQAAADLILGYMRLTANDQIQYPYIVKT